MKKIIFSLFLIFTLNTLCIPVFAPVYAINFGTYKSETEYGLIDGFKWNFFNRKEGEPLVQIKSETQEEQERIEREKNKPKEEQDDVQLYKFMLDNVTVF